VFDYLLMDQYPNAEDLAAVQKGLATSPMGTPLKASAMPWPHTAETAPAPPPTKPATPASTPVPLRTSP
jgi:penicillin-binding protein 2